jgi:hypothetical protein
MEPTVRDMLDELAAQREELVAQRARLAAAEARLAASERGRRRRQAVRRLRLPAALALALLLVALPASLLATDRFPDVPTDYTHHDDINQIAAAGITIGFPDGTYQPEAPVTRGQMASFLARTAGLGGRVPVAHATTLDGKSANEFARVSSAFGVASWPEGTGGTSTMPLASVTLDIPAPGYVLLLASGQASTGAASGCPCYVGIALGTPEDPGIVLGKTLRDDSVDDGVIEIISLAETRLLPVQGSGPQTFTARGGRILVDATGRGQGALSISATLTALYIPFGPNGGATDPLP